MIDKDRFGLNRIIAPSMKLDEFFDFAISVGIRKVELRNDMANPDPVDNLKPAVAARMAGTKELKSFRSTLCRNSTSPRPGKKQPRN